MSLKDKLMAKLAEKIKAEETEKVLQDPLTTEHDDISVDSSSYADVVENKLLSPKRLIRLLTKQVGV